MSTTPQTEQRHVLGDEDRHVLGGTETQGMASTGTGQRRGWPEGMNKTCPWGDRTKNMRPDWGQAPGLLWWG
jgi:hypothetical protein